MNKKNYTTPFVYNRFLSGLYFCFLVFLAGCGILPPASAAPVDVVLDSPQETIEGGVRLASVDSQWDGYGEVIDVRGEVMVIGASEWNQCGLGSVHVYRHSEGTWQKETQLVASDRDDFAQHARQFEAIRFGTSVDLGDGIIAVGAPGNVPLEEGGRPARGLPLRKGRPILG